MNAQLGAVPTALVLAVPSHNLCQQHEYTTCTRCFLTLTNSLPDVSSPVVQVLLQTPKGLQLLQTQFESSLRTSTTRSGQSRNISVTGQGTRRKSSTDRDPWVQKGVHTHTVPSDMAQRLSPMPQGGICQGSQEDQSALNKLPNNLQLPHPSKPGQ